MSTSSQPAVERIEQYLPGHWYWADLQTTDLDAATAFYTAIFGWETMDAPGGHGVYRLCSRDGMAMGALTPCEPGSDMPPQWFNYVTVTDVDATTARVAELGGTVIRQPFDAMDAGRMSVVADPTGAAFALWQAINHPGVASQRTHGAPCWAELHTSDIAAARTFYEGLLGYDIQGFEMGPTMTYYVASAGGSQACGMMQHMDDTSDDSNRWDVYFAVDDVDATHATALTLGATEVFGPHDIPDVGRSSILRDPQGALLHLMRGIPSS